MRNLCKKCQYTAVCLPTCGPVAFEMVFEKAAKQKGLPIAISKFELMTMRGGHGYLEQLTRVYNMAADKVPCERPHVRIETRQDADILEVGVRFSKNPRIGFCNIQDVMKNFWNRFEVK